MNYVRETMGVDDCLLHRVDNFSSLEGEFDEATFSICWENLTVGTTEKSSKLVEKILGKFSRGSNWRDRRSVEILKSASGYVEAGHMVAVMGPSGAGKTTLLDALAKRIRPSSGKICINGVGASTETVARISSYVPQFDPLPTTLTAGEYIAFSCALRLDRRTSSRDRDVLAADITANLGLDGCRDTVISALSGGEKKRLSLAVEIVTKPRILFLDEPTTGLDTSEALRVVESLKPVSTNGIVICSIHQPSMTIYKLFSRVIFLSDGRTAFSGALDDARTFFEREGFVCPIGFDEAEYYVKILSKRNLENFEHSKEPPTLQLEDHHSVRICRAYARSNFAKIPKRRGPPGTLEIEASQIKPRWIVQFNWLLWRRYLENRRTFADGLIAFQYYVISIVTISIFFWGIDTHKQRGVQDVMGVLYMASSEMIFSTAYAPINEIQREVPLYQRELSMYGPSAYYVAVAVNLVTKAIFKASLLSIMLFALLGTRTTCIITFLQFFACTVASGACGSAYGSMIASFVDNSVIATTIMVPLDLVAMLMAGVYYSLRSLNWYTVIFKYTSIFHYTVEALAIVHWLNINEIECDTERNLPCASTGSQVLLEYGYGESNFTGDILAMGALTILMNFIGYLGTRRRRRSCTKLMY